MTAGTILEPSPLEEGLAIRDPKRDLDSTLSPADEDDETMHLVCHCTDGDVSACGLDVSESKWVELDEQPPCPFCEAIWPESSPVCPWGCSCEDCIRSNW